MKVTYRGVSYDTTDRQPRQTVKKEVSETYRGVQHTEKVEVTK